MVFLKKKLKKIFYANTIRSLKNASSAELQKQSEKKAVAAFKHARHHLPYYSTYLRETGFKDTPMADIQSFKKHVPFLDKNTIYNDPMRTVVLKNLNMKQSPHILLSAGSSGTFSFGIYSPQQMSQRAEFLNVLLDNYFNILSQKTLIINCLAQAVRLPTLDATIVEIGPRTDAFIYLLKILSPQFEQTLIIGDNYFVKNSLEDGLNLGVNLTQLRIHLILGGVYLPEGLRTYLANLLTRDNNSYSSLIFSSMGISEFGLNLFFESKETIRLRQLTETNPALRQELLAVEDPNYTPMFFNYFPQTFYVEEINHQLVITNLNAQALLPLVRYNTQDHGKIIPYHELKVKLHEFNLTELLPPFKSPLTLMYGKQEFMESNGIKIYPQQIQKGMYEVFHVASLTTGYFRLNKNKHTLNLEIQLKKSISPNEALTSQFQRAILPYINVDLPVILHSYQNFPYGMEVDYERKFKYK